MTVVDVTVVAECVSHSLQMRYLVLTAFFVDSEADKKSSVDQAFRDVLLQLVVSCLFLV